MNKTDLQSCPTRFTVKGFVPGIRGGPGIEPQKEGFRLN